MISPVYSMMVVAGGDGLQREDALAVHAGTPHLDAAPLRELGRGRGVLLADTGRLRSLLHSVH
jgi:hypothetical protein